MRFSSGLSHSVTLLFPPCPRLCDPMAVTHSGAHRILGRHRKSRGRGVGFRKRGKLPLRPFCLQFCRLCHVNPSYRGLRGLLSGRRVEVAMIKAAPLLILLQKVVGGRKSAFDSMGSRRPSSSRSF